jgi:hypothetical protein
MRVHPRRLGAGRTTAIARWGEPDRNPRRADSSRDRSGGGTSPLVHRERDYSIPRRAGAPPSSRRPHAFTRDRKRRICARQRDPRIGRSTARSCRRRSNRAVRRTPHSGTTTVIGATATAPVSASSRSSGRATTFPQPCLGPSPPRPRGPPRATCAAGRAVDPVDAPLRSLLWPSGRWAVAEPMWADRPPHRPPTHYAQRPL